MGRRAFGIREERFTAYLDEIAAEGRRALSLYGLLVLPGAEITQNRLNGRKNSHIIALDIKQYISADLTADEIGKESSRNQNGAAAQRGRRADTLSQGRLADVSGGRRTHRGRHRTKPDGWHLRH